MTPHDPDPQHAEDRLALVVAVVAVLAVLAVLGGVYAMVAWVIG